ncbi:MAG: PA2169 family four-helix-bundle protein [Ignavibacteriae bacterium]|nr:PA2169 family four-helix-bundle protein [Ignavibacteriota bacterium]
MDSEQFRKVLLDLNEINNDRNAGYEAAAKETKDKSLRTLFHELASHSQNFSKEISSELQNIGVSPVRGTSQPGRTFRVAGVQDRKGILTSCETGESEALKLYRTVLQTNEDWPGNIRSTLERQAQLIQQDHDRIRSLRDSISS